MEDTINKSPETQSKTKKLILLAITLIIISSLGTFMIMEQRGNLTISSKLPEVFSESMMPEIPEPPKPKTISLLFLGDIMLDRGVRAQIAKIGQDLVFVKATRGMSDKYDLTVANLEGPITTYKSKTIGPDGRGISGFSFTFATSSAIALKESGIDIVSLANNHIENFGPEGMRQTVSWLKSAGMKYFGNPTNSGIEKNPPAPLSNIFCEKDICIALIGYHEFTYQNDGQVITEIENAKAANADFIIVMPHWGVEYEHHPNQKQKNLAHAWIDAGADLVVGSHPHVVQSIETYKDKKIYYSLGNYLFDQYFSYDTQHGLAVGFHISENMLDNGTTNAAATSSPKAKFKIESVDLIPIDNTNILTRPAGDIDTQKMLNLLEEISKPKI